MDSATSNNNRLSLRAVEIAALGVFVYVVVAAFIMPAVQNLYPADSDVYFPLTHFNDGAKYVFICNQGYQFPLDTPLTLVASRISWMPVYPLLQCGLHHFAGVSLVYAGFVVSTIAVGVALFFGVLTLANLNVRAPAIHALAALISPIAAAWLYLSGAEATYLAVSMIAMWLLTLPYSVDERSRREWVRMLAGAVIGTVLVLTKPNALALLLPFIFAFFFLSWQHSRTAGYRFGFWTFVADVVLEHLKPVLSGVQRLRHRPLTWEVRPIRYDWMPATTVAGILLGFAYWLAYTSLLSGIPFYFLQQQLGVWQPVWPSGNLGEMIGYFLQAFHGVTRQTYWRLDAAWYLAANLAPLIPAASRRVPPLIRGMLALMPVFLLLSGSVNGNDRHLLSTALVVIGWGCWLAPIGRFNRWAVARWVFIGALAVITSYLLLWHMFNLGALSIAQFLDT